MTDALGNLIAFRLLQGRAHGPRKTAALIAGPIYGQLLTARSIQAGCERT
jgi:hypothetical protein